jgi:cholesterol oxidase
MPDRYEAVIIGSGFGGAITACRLSKRWPGRVVVFERGKRYPMGSFPRTPHDLGRNFWNLPAEPRQRPRRMRRAEAHGMFDVRNYKHMDVVLGAGLGGGSLIYANVFLEPPEAVFDHRWPSSCTKQKLSPYYRVVKEVLGARPIPQDPAEPRRRIVRTGLFQDVARELGRDSSLVDINVFFGNDPDHPLPIGQQDTNRYGAVQTSCVYCAECDVGCNTHSKNTLDLNYLFVAEQRYGADLRTEHLVERIVPVNDRHEDDPSADGSHGYRVFYRDLSQQSRGDGAVLTNRVIVSAGTLGSTELLLRSKQVFKTLPRISDDLGQRFSGNGDFLSFVLDGQAPANPNYGPVITQRIDFNLFDNFDQEHAFILEDASYPAFMAWFAEGLKPGGLRLGALWQTLRAVVGRWLSGTSTGRIGYALSDLMSGDLSYHASVLLCMGLDRSNGVMSLDDNGYLSITWPYRDSLALYRAILKAGKQFCRTAAGKTFFPLPTWDWPFRKNVSVHPLGGCVLADQPGSGVTSAAPPTFGQVFGYQGLYVADGAIVPTAVGANPSATIAALSEMVAEGITGIPPNAEL